MFQSMKYYEFHRMMCKISQFLCSRVTVSEQIQYIPFQVKLDNTILILYCIIVHKHVIQIWIIEHIMWVMVTEPPES